MNNHVENIIEWAKDNPALTSLYLCDCSIKEIPNEIFDLNWLNKIDLSNNKILDIPLEIISLSKIESISLKNNSIKKIPKELVFLPNLRHLDISGNPLVEPPIEIANRGLLAIQNYYIELENESVEIHEAKLIIVGEGFVGKTTLMHRLIYNSFNPNIKSTEGIEINELNLKIASTDHFKINIWDFGGQEIYHATHQFFLTKRSLYLLIWDATKEDHNSCFDYWLNIIKLLSNSSPVIIVQNKIDTRIKNLDEESLLKSFPNIVGFYNVSAKSEQGITDLFNGIKNHITKLDHIGDYLPKVWEDIREELKNLKKKFILISDYYNICHKYNLNEESAKYLSQYYHDLGVFLHFQNNTILKEIIFLNPEWATNTVYSLTDQNEIISNFGKFDYDDLYRYWSNYPIDKYIHLLELMKKFELCFEIDDTKQYIIPELLPESKSTIQWENKPENINFEYHYQFMPKAIITRFIVRNHYLIYDNCFWKNGVTIHFENSKALIQSNFIEKKISINISGINKHQLLSIIRKEMDYIHRTLNDLNVMEMIPCCCEECIKSDKPHLYDFETLRKFQIKNKKTITCLKSINDVEINNLIGFFEPKVNEEILVKIYEMITELHSKEFDNKTISQKINEFIKLQPNFYGIGFDFNKLIEEKIKKRENKK